MGGCQGLGRGRVKSDGPIGMGFPFGMENTFWNLVEVVAAQDCKYTKRR